jgi:hypothetical protein
MTRDYWAYLVIVLALIIAWNALRAEAFMVAIENWIASLLPTSI